MVDSNYKFVCVEASAVGSQADVGFFSISSLGKSIESKEFDFPEPAALPNSTAVVPFVILADKGFPLKQNVLKPYISNHELTTEEKNFNYKLNKTRVYIENAFGIIASQFRLFNNQVEITTSRLDLVVIVAFLLHNILIDFEGRTFVEPSSVQNISHIPFTSNATDLKGNKKDKQTREIFKQYFTWINEKK